MRLLVVAALVIVAPAPADACPLGARCLLRLDTSGADEISAANKPVRLELRVRLRMRPALDEMLADAPAPPRTDPSDDPEVPWIWKALHGAVHDRMPTYDQPSGFSATLSPVVVAGTDDTVPGLGVAGEF